MNPLEVTFDSTVFNRLRIDAVEFLLDSQLGKRPLSKAIAARIRLQRCGKGYVLVPTDVQRVDEPRLYLGHIWKTYWALDGPSLPDPSFDLFVSPVVRWFLEQDNKHLFIVEEQMTTRDSGLVDTPPTAWVKFAGDSVYYCMNRRSAKTNIDQAIDDIWSAANDIFITGILTTIPDEFADSMQGAEDLSDELVNALVENSVAVITLAFDGEGHFIWWMAP